MREILNFLTGRLSEKIVRSEYFLIGDFNFPEVQWVQSTDQNPFDPTHMGKHAAVHNEFADKYYLFQYVTAQPGRTTYWT